MSESSTVIDYGHPAAHIHHEPPILTDSLGYPAHHFQDAGQQKEAATLGMWLFLSTEVLLFGGMFAGYFAYRHAYPRAWQIGSHRLSAPLGSINTAVLLTSSLFVALSIHAAQLGDRKWVIRWLGLTILLGMTFLGVKAREYYVDYKENLIPWWDYMPHAVEEAQKIGRERLPEQAARGGAKAVEEVRLNAEDLKTVFESHATLLPEHEPILVGDVDGLVRQTRLFFLFYFIMTIIHATHMVAGMLVLGGLAWLTHRGRFTARYYTPIEMAGLYWHFVDIVWVFLLPMLYFARPFHV